MRFRTGENPSRTLTKEIAALLALKLVALAFLFFAFFSPDKRLDVSAGDIDAILFESRASSTPEKATP